jgi:hypothetical protein
MQRTQSQTVRQELVQSMLGSFDVLDGLIDGWNELAVGNFSQLRFLKNQTKKVLEGILPTIGPQDIQELVVGRYEEIQLDQLQFPTDAEDPEIFNSKKEKLVGLMIQLKGNVIAN